ncbi:hypothetical protein TraAM80_00364 [Trypanosoma rangeli]|uniref:Fibronectin type-III domain-containing protein n=1 Tax=Trypanosoma rangeli TaxID=5698 RepID=A0A3R7MWD8_TRYRA|nr:uncharacterized protein TraAM80_00364 [Trypanosoma rangeli]RNF12353.1 hypothetical protein TraAM80_00364 [Trypanosoma rangeli]|eukprot:RNF12353.1 hypothetical protein TraAM80_00364 [Trypanosoma rangeli]
MLQEEECNIRCHAVVLRMGEIFGELGFEFDSTHLANDVTAVTKWNLHVDLEGFDGSQTAYFDEELPVEKGHKVVKLRFSRFYIVRVRVYSADALAWSAWSAPVRTATMHAVVAVIKEIGEDHVRVQWNRPLRDTTKIVPERDAEATQNITDISDFELRIIRENDMLQEFCDRFATGVRTYTVRGLKSGTAYIVMMRYRTLINTMKNWTEVGRFYTKPRNVISLVSRGENVVKVSWCLGPTPVDAVGYTVPETTPYRYEVSYEGGDTTMSPVQLPEQQHEYRVEGLSPGTLYTFYVRSFTVEGIWGNRSDPFKVRTADIPELSVAASGETFLSFTWMRAHDEPEESKVEFCLQSLTSRYKQQEVIPVGPRAEDKVIHVGGLTAGTEYSVSIRTFLQGEWGLWTEPQRFRTQSKLTLTFLERGEDFFTLALEEQNRPPSAAHLNIVVMCVGKGDERSVVLDKEIEHTPNEPSFRVGSLQSNTVYEVQCRRWQHDRITGDEGWGEFTAPIQMQTLQHLALHVWDIGEDFAQLVWRRGLSDTAPSNSLTEQPVPDLKYEVVVGCVDTGDDSIVHRQVLQANYTITNLRPATTYIVSVRACNELDQWGLWSQVRLRTLASVATSVHEIGEDFVRLMWQRENIDDEEDVRNSGNKSEDNLLEGTSRVVDSVASADMFVSRYAVFVCSHEDGESIPSTLSGYCIGGNSEVACYEIVTSEHTSLRMNELLPDREYVAVVRASTATGKWGLWSSPLRFRTNPQFRIPVNNLTIGENYVNLVWSRDAHPVVDKDVFLGDLSVTGQQLRIHGVDTPYSKDHALPADMRELKIYGLSPAKAYTIQIRVCGKGGDWGRWSPPVHILTRGTILTRAVEVAEDYIIITWERRKVANPKNYPTGRGIVTSYHLRVYNSAGIHSEVFLGDGDSPYRISNMTPDTYYCVEMKANYNDEEWGLWSTPMWCLTMKTLEIKTKLISEEFCCIVIRRPFQQKRLPEDDGNRTGDDRIVAFGQFRPNLMLCVTSPILNPTPHISTGTMRPRIQNSSLPPDASDHRLIYQAEILCASDDTDHTIPNLRSNMVYSVSVRSKLVNGEWGIWSQPSLLFATVPSTQVEFTDIGEKFVKVDWKRSRQRIPPQLKDPDAVKCGLGTISASRVKVREIGGSFQQTYELNNSLTTLRMDGLSPASTYAVSVQTYNDNYEWGVWSDEAKVRTIPGMDIAVQHISEDAVWVAWGRKLDVSNFVNYDTALNVDVVPSAYEISIIGGGQFKYTKEMNTNTLFFRGLQPDTVYDFQVRAQSFGNQEWGLWSTQPFRTKPRLRVTFGNVGEHFAIVEWRRHLPSSIGERDVNTVVESEDVVRQFRLKVERAGSKVPYVYDLSPYISSFCLKDLRPSSEYRVWLCAKGFEGVWGFWNEEARVRTLPKLELDVTAIGEDYVTVSWKRGKWVGETVGHTEASVQEMEGAVSGYRVRVLDEEGTEVVSRFVGFRETSCTLSPLKLSSAHSVEVAAKDTYDEWGLWSDAKRFLTLEAVDLRILRVGEAFAEVEWGRRRDLLRRRRDRRGAVRRRNSLLPLGDDVFARTVDTYTAEVAHSEGVGVSLDDDSDAEREASGAGLGCGASNGSPRDPNVPYSGEAHVDEEGHDSYEGGSGNEVEAREEEEEEEEEEEYEEEEDYYYDDALLHGDNGVLQWHLRVQGQRVFAGQPGAEDVAELYVPADELQRVISSLLPYAVYSVSVRGQDKGGAWGHWSQPRKLMTYPLLALTADSVTETFIYVSWSRPPAKQTLPEGFICFPPMTDIHNYQVHIEPLATEPPFDEQDEPLVNGARVYETSQPSLRLFNLAPGVRYRVVVREQMIDAQGDFVPDTWGCFSAIQVVETINPMRVVPIEIGEDYCLVGWHRMQRVADMASDISLVTGLGKVTAYEMRAVRLDEKAKQKYHGPLALDTIVSLESSETSYHLGNLVSNTIYALSVRAQTEGYWGPWSATTKFVSQSRLQVKVRAVYEDVFVVSWRRPLPDWALSRADYASPGGVARSPFPRRKTDMEVVEKDAVERETQDDCKNNRSDSNSNTGSLLEKSGDDFDSVLICDYSVDRYELYVEGVTCDLHQCLTLPKEKMSARITGLEHNQIYSVCIRSQSEKQHWSMLSRRESLLTLTPMCVELSHYTETMVLLRWFRAPQDIMEYDALLQSRRAEEERRCDERERQDLFELKRRAQEMEESAERKYLSDHLAMRREHNAARRMDAVHHLQAENVALGDAEVTGYQLKFMGEVGGCMPSIPGLHRMLLQQRMPHLARRRQPENTKKVPSKQRQQISPDANADRIASDAGTGGGRVSPATTGDEGLAREEASLIDVHLGSHVMSLTVKDLAPCASFAVQLRARNAAGDWCPWSRRESFTTLKPIELHQNRFGEHYINLYWHRLSAAFMQKMEDDEAQLQELNKGFSHMSPKDLEDKKRELPESEYDALLEGLKGWRDLKRYVANVRSQLSRGLGEVMVHEATPVKGYQLRIIHESGTFLDYYINGATCGNSTKSNSHDANDDVTTETATSATIDTTSSIHCAYTVTGLVSNTMYIALLCADYGFAWGPWTPPLRFMTQNLIQLSITYISEVFVDVEWYRAPNKTLPPDDQNTVVTSDVVSSEARVCQVRITWEDEENDGKVMEEYRTIRSFNVFRIDKLRTDTKYTFALREWDAEGDWGLWCAPRTCVTLPGMQTTVKELGEDWAEITWCRKERCVDYDDDIDVLQYDLEKVSYYLRVQELPETDAEGEAHVIPSEEMREGSADVVLLDEMEDIFATTQIMHGVLPRQEYPVEFVGERYGLQYLLRRFDKDTMSFRLENLHPDRFYNVQVMCETPEERLGAWSSDRHFITMSKIKLLTQSIDEQYVDLSWQRLPPREHPLLNMSEVFTGHYTTSAYVLEVKGADGFYICEQLQGHLNNSYHLKGLTLNTVYSARVYSINDEGVQSLWSEMLHVATLDRVKVQPTEISEQSIMLEWGREEQRPTCAETGDEYDPTICVGSRESGNYILRVYQAGDSSRNLLLEKSFPGSVCNFLLVSLTPNTPYVVSVRAANLLGEWGMWSEERCVYTMKLICAEIAAVGEDYIRFSWTREEPDELQIGGDGQNSPRQFKNDGNDVSVVELGEEEATVAAGDANENSTPRERRVSETVEGVTGSNTSHLLLEANAEDGFQHPQPTRNVIRKKYPLMDRPERKTAVYQSAKTRIEMYAVSVRGSEGGEDYTIEVPGDATSFTVPSLRPDTRYSLAVSARYSSGEWGVSSAYVTSGTLNLITVELRGLGEDYLTATWKRLPITYDASTVSFGRSEDTVFYELAVHDFTDVSFGEEDAEELPPRLWSTVFVPAKMRSCTVRDLLSHHRYRVCVRRWYKPLEAFVNDASVEIPRTDEEQVLEGIQRNHGSPGTWGECLYDVTLRDMVCTMEDSAEEFFVVRWERDPRAQALPVRNPFAQMPVQGYHLRIDEVAPDGAVLDASADPVHIDQSLDAHETSYTAQNLRPDSLYRIDVRCRVDNNWGHWSRNLFVRTLPKLVIDTVNIGEDYAFFSWQRPRRNLLLPDGTEVFCGSGDNIDRFHLEVVGHGHRFHVSKKFKVTRNTYRVKHLESNNVYSVVVRSCDASRDVWSLWSDRVFFATLKPMQLTVGPAAEQFALVEWKREEQTPEEYTEMVGEGGGVVQLGNPEVIAYHLCVFSNQHTPSVAAVDKQFPKDVTRYCFGSLKADTPYVAILRSCNKESRWGLWSKEGCFRTQRILSLCAETVGENCVRVKWERAEVDCSDDGRSAGTKAEPIVYQLLLKTGSETIERLVHHSECGVTEDDFKLPTYVVEGLTPATNYLMALQPGYEENRWGLWTPSISFKTRPPISITATTIGSNRLVLALGRNPEIPLREEGLVEGGNESPERVVPLESVVSYQLVLFKLIEQHTEPERERGSDTNVFASLFPSSTGAPPSAIAASAHDNSTPADLAARNPEISGAMDAERAAVASRTAHVVAADQTADVPVAVADADARTNDTDDGSPVVKDRVAGVVIEDDVSPHEWRERGSLSRSALMFLPAKKENAVLEREFEVNKEDPTNTICELEELESSVSYKVRARALDENGMWGAWTELTVETVPFPPHSVALHRINAQFCMLQWEAPDNHHLYRYVVEQTCPASETRGKAKGGAEWRVADVVEETFCRVRFIVPPNKMRCRVKAARVGEGHDFSEFCEPVKLSSGVPPEPVTNLCVTAIARNFITVEWAQSRSEIAGTLRQARTLTYRVYLAVRDKPPILVTTVPQTTSYTLEDLVPSTAYTIQVVVENADGMSYNNPMVSAVTRSEQDETVLRQEEGQPPLGTIVEPLSPIRCTALPEIPSARPTLAPRPPSRSKRAKSRGRSTTRKASLSPNDNRGALQALPHTGSASNPMGSSAKRGTRDRLPSIRRTH